MNLKQSPEPTPQNDNEEWFSTLFGERPSFASSEHPSLEQLKLYHEIRLLNEDREKVFDTNQTQWTMTKVSFHLLDCESCQSQIAQLRRLEVICHRSLQPSRWKQFTEKLLQPRAVFLHLKTLAMVAVILLFVNAVIWLWSNPFNPVPQHHEPTLVSVATTSSTHSEITTPAAMDPKPADIGGGSDVYQWQKQGIKPEERTPATPVGSLPQEWPTALWWSLSFLLLWAALWFAHMLTQTQQERLRQALQRMFSPEWQTEPRFDAQMQSASLYVSSWASFVRC